MLATLSHLPCQLFADMVYKTNVSPVVPKRLLESHKTLDKVTPSKRQNSI